MSGRLTAGLVVLGALVAGVALGLVLVAPAGPSAPAPPPSSPVPSIPTVSSSASDADLAATSVLADALVDALRRGDATEFGRLTCRPQTSQALADLQAKWDAAGPLTVTLAAPPAVAGDSAGVTVHVEGAGGRKDTPFPMHRENGRWCVPG
ncbi:hypothetical protein VSH64_13300 [Amycolatopsis rhabdoformis]|uniref:DUF4878 domain-containing protein n=1 Tax=Amycolatopsis rhabdoformis TaxID=1448059 RepID=A0ABZ1IF83_9PSEU|nr:hypothetical protein [Amycolatopsis rhabdoformis]WSE33080.1 hypothetical protein VSH64_13300 [Amycolatopsis rhabdoformis]